jgi:hypothetical protein
MVRQIWIIVCGVLEDGTYGIFRSPLELNSGSDSDYKLSMPIE